MCSPAAICIMSTSPSTPKQAPAAAIPQSPAANTVHDITSPRPANSVDVRPVPVDTPLKDLSIYSRGSFATSGKVIRAHDKVMQTASGTPYFFFVLQDEVQSIKY